MRVLHIPFTFYPDALGGTEVYVEGLIRSLKKIGWESAVAAPGNRDETYEYEGIRVHRYAQGATYRIRELYGEGYAHAAKYFDSLLALDMPDIVHLHAFNPGVSLLVIRSAKKRNIPIAFTYHTPTVTCQRGTMMQFGAEPCSGVMRLHGCAACSIQEILERSDVCRLKNSVVYRLTVRLMAMLLGSLPPTIGKALGRFNLEGGHWTALRMTELLELRQASAKTLLKEVDHIIAVSQWVREVIISNGVLASNITVSRHGINGEQQIQSCFKQAVGPDRVLKIAYLGRLHPTKGLHILIRAFHLISKARLQLVIYGVVQGEEGRAYERHLHELASWDSRIQFRAPIRSTQVPEVLKEFDLLAVPSQWLETGPLVVLEAFAAGIPVIGSRLGGISELVSDGVNGLLVDPENVEQWAEKIEYLANDPILAHKLRSNVRYPRSMSDVAEDMVRIYKSLLARVS